MNEEHRCYFCGEFVKDGLGSGGKRHWLSDCRPDLVKHEIGETCTWDYRRKDLTNAVTGEVIPALPENQTCYAYQDDTDEWTNDHIHFYEDGPM